jgi:hypothetical protein
MTGAAFPADTVPTRPTWRSLLWILPVTVLWFVLIYWQPIIDAGGVPTTAVRQAVPAHPARSSFVPASLYPEIRIASLRREACLAQGDGIADEVSRFGRGNTPQRARGGDGGAFEVSGSRTPRALWLGSQAGRPDSYLPTK